MRFNIHNINYKSTTCGPGERTELFLQGCSHGCAGCFSKETWDRNKGSTISWGDLKDFLYSGFEEGQLPYLTLCGGEPLDQPRQVLKILKETKKRYQNSHIIIYTGKTILEADKIKQMKKIRKLADAVVYGEYVKELSCMSKDRDFIGSSNQLYVMYNINGDQQKIIEGNLANVMVRKKSRWFELGL